MSGFLSGFRFPYVKGQNMTTYFHIRDQTRFMLLFRQRKSLEGSSKTATLFIELIMKVIHLFPYLFGTCLLNVKYINWSLF